MGQPENVRDIARELPLGVIDRVAASRLYDALVSESFPAGAPILSAVDRDLLAREVIARQTESMVDAVMALEAFGLEEATFGRLVSAAERAHWSRVGRAV